MRVSYRRLLRTVERANRAGLVTAATAVTLFFEQWAGAQPSHICNHSQEGRAASKSMSRPGAQGSDDFYQRAIFLASPFMAGAKDVFALHLL